MVSGGQIRSFDLMRQVGSTVTNFFNPKEHNIVPPSDGPVLRLHYRWTFFLTMLGFATIWYSWFHRDVIVCVSHFNIDTQVRLDHLNICLSYPYIKEEGQKLFFLFYRWIHWVLFLASIVFYLPHKLAKLNHEVKIARLFEYLDQGCAHYEGETHLITTVARFLGVTGRTHDNIYIRYVISNIFALVLDFLVFFSLDALFLNKFATLGIDAFPYIRDGQHLSDPLTQAFMPFVDCTIAEPQLLANKRAETYGCHLTVMEFYEKLMLILWAWMIIVMIVSTVYIVFLIIFFFPGPRRLIFKFSKLRLNKIHDFDHAMDKLEKQFRVGDFFILYKAKDAFRSNGFWNLLLKLSDADTMQQIKDSARKDFPAPPSSGSCSSDDGYNTPPNNRNKGILVE